MTNALQEWVWDYSSVVELPSSTVGEYGLPARLPGQHSPLRYPHSQEQPGKTPSPSNGSILVVDDDPAILSTVSDILSFEGYDVARATNGEEALRIMERMRPELVLLDMRMPVVDGWAFARILQERDISVPILVMTAAQDARRWAQEIGAQGYIAKPFDLLDLLDAVEQLLS